MELIVLNLGYDLGILSPRIFAMMVLMALTTTAMTGPLLTLLRLGGQGGPVHARRSAGPRTPPRVRARSGEATVTVSTGRTGDTGWGRLYAACLTDLEGAWYLAGSGSASARHHTEGEEPT